MKIFLFIVGILSLGLAVAGMVLPIVPATPFLLLAVYGFSKSNVRLHRWMLQHPVMGNLIKDWQQGGVIRTRAKIVAIFLIGVGIATVWLKTPNLFPGFRPLISILMAGIAAFIATRPSKRPQ